MKNKPLLFRTKKYVFLTYFLKDCAKKVLKISKSMVLENFRPMPLCPMKWWPFKVSAKLCKSSLLIANIANIGTVSGLR